MPKIPKQGELSLKKKIPIKSGGIEKAKTKKSQIDLYQR